MHEREAPFQWTLPKDDLWHSWENETNRHDGTQYYYQFHIVSGTIKLNTYCGEDYNYCIRSLLLLAWKTANVHREVNLLYSLKNIINPAETNTLYPFNLATRLHQDLSSQSCRIQRKRLAIYNSLNRAKKDSTHPIWSAITRQYTPTQFHLCAAVSCALKNLCEKTTRSINPLTYLFLNGIFNHPKSLELFLELLHIYKRHGIGWHTLKSYDQFGDGWHK